jgi:hypothetical protein
MGFPPGTSMFSFFAPSGAIVCSGSSDPSVGSAVKPLPQQTDLSAGSYYNPTGLVGYAGYCAVASYSRSGSSVALTVTMSNWLHGAHPNRVFCPGSVGTDAPPAAPQPGSAYPWANALCEFGAAGGSDCHDPSDRKDNFLWYVDENHNGHLGVSRPKLTCGTRPAASGECFDPWGYNYRNCTSYVAWRLSTLHETNFSQMGNASQWVVAARTRKGVIASHAPTPGSVAVWTGLDHVAFVESVTARVAYVSDFNGLNTGSYTPARLAAKVFKSGALPSIYLTFPKS